MANVGAAALRAARVGAGLVAVVGGAGALIVRRQAAAVKIVERTDLDAAMEPPSDVVHHSFATSDGGSVHVVEMGTMDQPVVVLLHGITNQWWMWSSVMRLLAPHYRVFSWDMRGFGASRAGKRGVALDAAAEDLSLLLEHFDLHQAVIVGHSMGGMVLGRFAVDFPVHLRSRVSGLVFLGTTANSMDGTIATGGLVRLSRSMAKLARRGVSSASYSWKDNDLSIVLLRGGFGRTATAKMVDDVRRCQAETLEASAVEGTESIGAHNVLESLRTVTVPTAIVVGSDDRLTPPLHSYALQRAMPHAVVTELPGIGHNVMQEKPEAVANAVRSLAR